jgi:hypothetical protein
VAEEDRETEAKEALERVSRDSETIGTSSLARMGRRTSAHFTGSDAVGAADDGGTDSMEVWGRRIGRGLSVIGFVVLTWWLGLQLGWW